MVVSVLMIFDSDYFLADLGENDKNIVPWTHEEAFIMISTTQDKYFDPIELLSNPQYIH